MGGKAIFWAFWERSFHALVVACNTCDIPIAPLALSKAGGISMETLSCLLFARLIAHRRF